MYVVTNSSLYINFAPLYFMKKRFDICLSILVKKWQFR